MSYHNKNKLNKIVAVAERCLVITEIPDKESKKQLFWIYFSTKLVDGRKVI